MSLGAAAAGPPQEMWGHSARILWRGLPRKAGRGAGYGIPPKEEEERFGELRAPGEAERTGAPAQHTEGWGRGRTGGGKGAGRGVESRRRGLASGCLRQRQPLQRPGSLSPPSPLRRRGAGEAASRRACLPRPRRGALAAGLLGLGAPWVGTRGARGRCVGMLSKPENPTAGPAPLAPQAGAHFEAGRERVGRGPGTGEESQCRRPPDCLAAPGAGPRCGARAEPVRLLPAAGRGRGLRTDLFVRSAEG